MLTQRKVVALTLLVGLKSVVAEPFETPASSPSSEPVCSNYAAVMRQVGFPRRAVELNLKQGSAVLEFTLTSEGKIKDITAVESSHPVFAQAATDIVKQYECRGLGRDIRVRVPFKFQLSG
jgi:TonB family protein